MEILLKFKAIPAGQGFHTGIYIFTELSNRYESYLP